MTSQWREFPFFEVTPITDPGIADTKLFSDPGLLAIEPVGDLVAFSTANGNLCLFDRELRVKGTYQPHNDGAQIFHIKSVPGSNHIFATAATRQGAPTIVSLCDARASTEKKLKVLSQTLVTNGNNNFPLTVFTMAKDAAILALGFADGAVVVVRGDIVHDRGSRQRIVYTAPTPVTGLCFPGSETDFVLVASLNRIISVYTAGMALSKQNFVLDKDKGAELRCTSVNQSGELVTGRDDGIAFYSAEKRGPTLDFPVVKRAIFAHQQYIVILAVWQPRATAVLETEALRLVILDTKNNFLAYSGHVSSPVKHFFEAWGILHVLCADGVLLRLEELSIEAKIDTLRTQQLFQVAIKLAKTAEQPESVVMGLHQDYADFLYDKDDYNGALDHYVHALNLGNTSHAILKFKHRQHLERLTTYLEALEEANLATQKHLSLLLICYTSLNDRARLTSFLKRAVKLEQNMFDFQVAINICRDAKFYDLAAYVAKAWPDPDAVVQIKVRDMKDFKGCLDYICQVSVPDALRILVQNSRMLLHELPIETTAVLITLFTGKYVPREGPIEEEEEAPAREVSALKIAPPLIQSYQAFINYITSSNFMGSSIVDASAIETHQAEHTYQPPRPRLIFPSFIGHSNEFVVFLEACLEAAKGFQPAEKDLSDIVTTLYEVYISLAKENPDGEWTDKAKRLVLERKDLIDINRASMVTQVAGAKLSADVRVALGETHEHIFRSLVEDGRAGDAIELVEEHWNDAVGKSLAAVAVRSLQRSTALVEVVRPKLTDFLTKVTHDNSLSSVEAIECVCACESLTVGDVRPFLNQFVQRYESEIAQNQKVGDSYRREAQEKREQVRKLRNDPRIIQYGKCDLCQARLDLPAVHVACGHSFHERCLADQTRCRICSAENESVEALRRSERESALRQQVFFESLEAHSDKLRAINDYVSRGGLM